MQPIVLLVSSLRTAFVLLAPTDSQEVHHARLTKQMTALLIILSWTMGTVFQMVKPGPKSRKKAVTMDLSSWTMATVKKSPSLALTCAALAEAVTFAETDRLEPKANMVMIARKLRPLLVNGLKILGWARLTMWILSIVKITTCMKSVCKVKTSDLETCAAYATLKKLRHTHFAGLCVRISTKILKAFR